VAFYLFLAYVVAVILAVRMENSFVFYGLTEEQGWASLPEDENWEDVSLISADGTKIHALWWPRDGADGALLFCHGNGGNVSHCQYIARSMRDVLNVSVLVFDHPGYGKSEGHPSEAGCYAAGEAAHRWLTQEKNHPVPPEKVILWGESLGGGIATDLAMRHPYRALMLYRTFTSVPDVGQRMFPWLPVRWVARTRFDNLSRLPHCRGPVLFTHAVDDDLIPIEQAEALYAAAPEPKYMYWEEDAHHHSAFPVEFLVKAKQFLEKVEAQENER
jgi:fermentation-respiration switch protein FrsA (DUF1100 family)